MPVANFGGKLESLGENFPLHPPPVDRTLCHIHSRLIEKHYENESKNTLNDLNVQSKKIMIMVGIKNKTSPKMKLSGYIIVMVCCFGLAFTDFSKKRFLLRSETITTRIIIAGQGVLLLVYPVLGHLADVYLTRYRVLKASLIILTTITITNLVYLAIDTATSIFTESMILHHTTASPLFAYNFIIIMYMIGVGLYEAKIVQFGLDQLLEAPTTKLISFINWYYWVQSVGELVQFYV